MQKFQIVKKPAYAIESVDNALQLILLLHERDALRVNEAAERLGVAPSTAHRLLATLVYRGFALQDESRRYTAGPALRGATRQGRLQDVVAVAHPSLEELAAAVGETVNFVARFGTSVRFLASVESTQLLRVGERAGTVLPARLSSGGKAILATLDDQALHQLYTGRAAQLAGDQLGADDFRALQDELAVVRTRGYALNLGRTEPDIAAMGRAVGPGRAWLAVSISAPSSRADVLERPETVAALAAACDAAAAALVAEKLNSPH
ncbi:IclR family transcriptional regulator [Sinomonas sp. ASV322]|uniref:IclR family transcriptional regulator n=1 Tax=Sinomonas sp. ASV322 TaxID=3041920 RepID=UPI0027DDA26D|nr:IclR family transcriptional regulator [Sinomonas sp. ASV322]MDQ4502880.1 IclR family transcriptional regulator [Sinomonas sp. ASV322]